MDLYVFHGTGVGTGVGAGVAVGDAEGLALALDDADGDALATWAIEPAGDARAKLPAGVWDDGAQAVATTATAMADKPRIPQRLDIAIPLDRPVARPR